ncbi:MAG TPA: GNAT family N-acetyltransferase [Polyangiales bacterium]|nr:GNAT family N-acetyltransferase [Polyangiales bacterium]
MSFRVRQVDWAEAGPTLMAIRRRVFVDEQHVPIELEQDGLDPECVHVLAEDQGGQPIGTGRLRGDGRIGRMAVLADQRGGGVGAVILRALTDAARARGLRELELHAQTSAQAFYEREGWQAHGEVYLEAGIPHVDMRKRL